MTKIVFKEIKNQLNTKSIKGYKHIELKVNDMHLKCYKENDGKWHVIIFHEEKDTHKDRYFIPNELIKFLNAYIITSRSKTLLFKDEEVNKQ